jgi:hypothetical protein
VPFDNIYSSPVNTPHIIKDDFNGIEEGDFIIESGTTKLKASEIIIKTGFEVKLGAELIIE